MIKQPIGDNMRQEKINYAECCEKYASTDEKALINGFGKKFDPLPMDEKKRPQGAFC